MNFEPRKCVKIYFSTVKSEAKSLSPDSAWVTQDVIINPDIKYAFAVKAVNVQGGSDYSVERIKELKGNPLLGNVVTVLQSSVNLNLT